MQIHAIWKPSTQMENPKSLPMEEFSPPVSSSDWFGHIFYCINPKQLKAPCLNIYKVFSGT